MRCKYHIQHIAYLNMSTPQLRGLFFLCCYFSVVKCEIFTALVHLEGVLQAEEYLASYLKLYVQNERDKLNRIEAVADEYEAHSVHAQLDVDHHLSNPVNAYLLVKRLTTDWLKVQELIDSHSNFDALKRTIVQKSDIFPNEDDLQGAGEALLRLQDTYSLDTEHIVRGSVKGVAGSTLLTAGDSFELGRIAYIKDDFYHCLMWMEQALRCWGGEDEKTVPEADVLDYLSFAHYKQGNLHHAVNYTKRWLELEPGHERAISNLNRYQKDIEKHTAIYDHAPSKKLQNIRPRDEYTNSDLFRNYEKLCQGMETHKLQEAHKLHCHHKRDHPLFVLAPLKVEVINIKPWIGFFYDVLTDVEIEKVKDLAQQKLSRSHIFGSRIRDIRTSKNAWLADEEHPLIKHISMKVGALSDLSTSTVEHWQVLNYGIGGHYEPHHDFAWHPEERFTISEGNRIATVLCYLTDVEAGGATIFPRFGAKVSPKKGACVMWYNLLRNGEGDYNTEHAGCPVLAGTKWVCNKWFHVRGQEFIRPCTLDPSE